MEGNHMESKNIAQLVQATEKFKFSGNISVSKVLEIIAKIDESFRNYAILNQVSRIQFLPYIIIFKANETIILQPFMQVFEALKVLIASKFVNFNPEDARFIVHGRFIIIDVSKTSQERAALGLYSIAKKTFVLNEERIEKLDYFQEVEVKLDSETVPGFKLSKKV